MKIDMFESTRGLEQVMNYHNERHGLLAANLANADTPGYRSKDIVFADSLTAANSVTQTHAGHRGGTTDNRYFVHYDQDPVNPDQNGVRLEKAMARLTGNKIRFNTSVELTRRQLNILKYAARNGGS